MLATRWRALALCSLCLPVVLILAEEGGESDKGSDSKANFSVAMMLLLSITFMMSTFYFLNVEDKDLKLAAWSLVSSTISIFCAVLLFQAVNGCLERFIMEGQSEDVKLAIDFGHAILWYLGLQAVLAYISGAVTAGEIMAQFSRAKEEVGEADEASEEGNEHEDETEESGFQLGDVAMIVKPFDKHGRKYKMGMRGEVTETELLKKRVKVHFWSGKAKTEAKLSEKDKAGDEIWKAGESKKGETAGMWVKTDIVKGEEFLKRQLNMKCWAVLFGHITGFAMINAFATAQVMFVGEEEWSDNWSSQLLRGGVMVVAAAVGLKLLFNIFQMIRQHINLADDGVLDEKEKLWVEETTETEDDVMGLTLSFVVVQMVRFMTTGVMPNEEGEVENELARPRQFRPSYGRGMLLFLIGLLTYLVHVARVLLLKKTCPGCHGTGKEEEEEQEEEEEEEEEGKVEKKCSKCKGLGKADLIPCNERSKEQAAIVAGMVFSWCVFFGVGWIVDLALRDGLGYEAGSEDTLTTSSVLVAGVLLAWSYTMIVLIDKLADAEMTSDELWETEIDKALRGVNKALAILIGFSWERAFDASVVRLAKSNNKFMSEVNTKLLLSVFLCVIVIPAWRLYILPELQRLGEFEEEDEEAATEARDQGEFGKDESIEDEAESETSKSQDLTAPLLRMRQEQDAALKQKKGEQIKQLQKMRKQSLKARDKTSEMLSKTADTLRKVHEFREKLRRSVRQG